MDLSPDQQQALDALWASVRSGNTVSVLVGPAGSGKTTLMRTFGRMMIDRGWNLSWAAPTGKAAVRLSGSVGSPAATLHSLLYRRFKEGSSGQPIFMDRREKLSEDGSRTLLVVDEGSMVGKRLFDDLVAAAGDSSLLLFVADACQVMPVADQLGPPLFSPTAELTTIHRQALESPILRVATDVRMGKPMSKESIGDAYVRRPGTAMDVAKWLSAQIKASEDAVAICATNQIRQNINRLCRKELGYKGVLQPGEQIMFLLNNKYMGRMNGEVARVDAVSEVLHEDKPSGLLRVRSGDDVFFVHADTIGKSVVDFKKATARRSDIRNPQMMLHIDYGYAVTIHKSQGSEWKKVCFAVDNFLRMTARRDASDARRLAYTAITRAREKLIIVDL